MPTERRPTRSVCYAQTLWEAESESLEREGGWEGGHCKVGEKRESFWDRGLLDFFPNLSCFNELTDIVKS